MKGKGKCAVIISPENNPNEGTQKYKECRGKYI